MFFFRNLDSENDINSFIGGFQRETGFSLDKNYLRQGQIVGMFSREGQLVGGYCLITEPAFRSLMFLPENLKQNVTRKLKKVAEVNGVFINKELRKQGASMTLWNNIGKTILKNGINNIGSVKTHWLKDVFRY